MFTGIITDIGYIAESEDRPKGRAFTIYCHYFHNSIDIGDSIACNGVCLTVIEKKKLDSKNQYQTEFKVECWEEALRLTTASDWAVEDFLNLETSLKLNNGLGGHLVSGHVDDYCRIVDIQEEGSAKRFFIEIKENLKKFIVPKGSITLDGTSLTINNVDKDCFDVLIIAHTLKVTNWSQKKINDFLNIEVDQFARYSQAFLASEKKRIDQEKKILNLGEKDMKNSRNSKFLIIDARYYEEISENLYQGAIKVLKENEIDYDYLQVPGALEIPAAIAMTEQSKKYSAYIALGCIIRGETYHFDIVANESARGLMQLSIENSLAIGNAILTVENKDQALKRASNDSNNKGAFAASAALQMSTIYKKFLKS